MTKLLTFQSNLFLTISIIMLVLAFGLDPRQSVLIMMLSLGCIVVMGVPHGSLDVLFARKTYELKYLKHWVKFISYYLIAAFSIILFWMFLPNVFFVIFLVLSALHFSDDLNLLDFGIIKFSYGASIITLPSLFFSHQLIELYAMLIEKQAATMIVNTSRFIAVLVLLMLTVQLLNKRINLRSKLEAICVCTIFLLLHPIIAFAIYFCIMHSARHLIRSHFFLRKFSSAAFFNALILPTIAVIMMGILIWWLGVNENLETEMMRIIFIGLAALTVPHAWVLEKSNFLAWSISEQSRDD
jgi:Brp/Blh family beta-carotene 15,15'-monooxygenase